MQYRLIRLNGSEYNIDIARRECRTARRGDVYLSGAVVEAYESYGVVFGAVVVGKIEDNYFIDLNGRKQCLLVNRI